MQNQIDSRLNYFYMDNYYLKTAVEMGIVGLAAFAVLIGNALMWSLRALRRIRGSRYYYLVQGTFAGMCGVAAHNFVENVFEVPMMVTYFWLFAGVNIFLAYIAACEPGATTATDAANERSKLEDA
jgi:O-antigen ligase